MKLKRLKTVEVIVLPLPEADRFQNYSDQQRCTVAERLRQDILRHCDTAGAVVHTHSETVCSHCGYPWEELPEGPQCCTKAQDEWAMTSAKINQG